MVAPITIQGGITFEGGITAGNVPLPPAPTLMLNLDADTYDNTTTGSAQNVSGTSDNVGFFPYAWPAYSVIQPGWTCVQTGAVVTAVDGVNHVITTVGTPFTSGDSYTFTGANSWIDSVSDLPFILYNGVTLSSSGGNSMAFVSSSGQYAQCSTSLSSMSTWSAVAWHYYDGTNTGASPCIITEVFTGGGINYALGSLNDNSPLLMAGWYNGGWNMPGYTLTAGNWYQIVGTYDGSHVRLYINTQLVRETPSTGAATSSGSGIKLMNRWDVGATEYWGGKLGQVQVYDGAMRFGDIVTNWNANKARYGL